MNMSARQMVIPRKDKDLDGCGAQRYRGIRPHVCNCVCVCLSLPVVVGEARPPVGRPQQRLQRAGQVHKQVTHQEEPERSKASEASSEELERAAAAGWAGLTW